MFRRWDPFTELTRLQGDLARIGGFARPEGRRGDEVAFQPAVDVYESKDAVLLMVELPGVRADDVKVDVDDGVLTVRGERRPRQEVAGEALLRVERAHGTFARSFRLSKTVDPSGVEASMEDGVLTLRVPKRVEAQPRRVQVKVASREQPSPGAPGPAELHVS